jgi:hypothetical protein
VITLELVFLVVAVAFLALAASGVSAGRFHLGWAGLALVTIVWLLQVATAAGAVHG